MRAPSAIWRSLTTPVVLGKQRLLHGKPQLLYDGAIMNALQQAVDRLGGQAALAAAVGVKQQHVWNWLNRGGSVPTDHCAAIEQATDRAVMRWDLRPNDWHRVWPELINQPGAPAIPEPAKAA
jgi:DNA-binding transcriptional regulator YdaS (Cro superfamily)